MYYYRGHIFERLHILLLYMTVQFGQLQHLYGSFPIVSRSFNNSSSL